MSATDVDKTVAYTKAREFVAEDPAASVSDQLLGKFSFERGYLAGLLAERERAAGLVDDCEPGDYFTVASALMHLASKIRRGP